MKDNPFVLESQQGVAVLAREGGAEEFRKEIKKNNLWKSLTLNASIEVGQQLK